MSTLTDYVVFKDNRLAQKYTGRRIPMAVLYEAYFDGAIDIPGDLFAFLRKRDLFVDYNITSSRRTT